MTKFATKSPIRSPEIVELRAFCLAADLGSLSRTAQVLRISQPALSKKIRVLEALVGSSLFERTVRGVSLTPAGKRLYPEARKLLTQVDVVGQMMVSLPSDDSPIKLAISHTIAEYILPSILVKLEAQHRRHLSIELLVSNSHAARESIRSGRADIGIVASAPHAADHFAGSVVEIPYLDDEIVVVVPMLHPWRQLAEIPLDTFLQTPLIMRDPSANSRRIVDHFVTEQGLELAQPTAELGSTHAIIATAVAECTPALISRFAAESHKDRLRIKPLTGLRFPRQFVIVLEGTEETLSTSARSLLQYFVSECADRLVDSPPD